VKCIHHVFLREIKLIFEFIKSVSTVAILMAYYKFKRVYIFLVSRINR
jgi:hypothetical protein